MKFVDLVVPRLGDTVSFKTFDVDTASDIEATGVMVAPAEYRWGNTVFPIYSPVFRQTFYVDAYEPHEVLARPAWSEA